jgi:multiple sugar transport system substrate-binding protein
MVTIKDVAKQAGVSIATVSCALSGKKNVSHQARVRIMEAIEKLNYVPNESARKL